jgi:hypothetical protein
MAIRLLCKDLDLAIKYKLIILLSEPVRQDFVLEAKRLFVVSLHNS